MSASPRIRLRATRVRTDRGAFSSLAWPPAASPLASPPGEKGLSAQENDLRCSRCVWVREPRPVGGRDDHDCYVVGGPSNAVSTGFDDVGLRPAETDDGSPLVVGARGVRDSGGAAGVRAQCLRGEPQVYREASVRREAACDERYASANRDVEGAGNGRVTGSCGECWSGREGSSCAGREDAAKDSHTAPIPSIARRFKPGGTTRALRQIAVCAIRRLPHASHIILQSNAT